MTKITETPGEGEKNRLKASKIPYSIRREYQQVQPDVAPLLEQKSSVKYAWMMLRQEGRLTMAYPTFLRCVRADGHLSKRMKKSPRSESKELPCEILDLRELETYHPRSITGHDLNSVYHTLVDLGVVTSGFSDFCDHFEDSQI